MQRSQEASTTLPQVESALTTPKTAIASTLNQLMHKRLRKFVAQLPKVLSEEHAEAVHDLRVASRRLQQVIAALFPKQRSPQAQEAVRTLKRARRAVAKWRDCDVLLELVDRKLKRLRNDEERLAWQFVRDYLREKRLKAIARARDRLASRRLLMLAQAVKELEHQALETSRDGAQGRSLHPTMVDGVRRAWDSWREALALAAKNADPESLHAFRIQTKRLRYRLELALEAGTANASSALAWLRHLQDSLGRLHDRDELARIASKALAQPDFLLNHPRAASQILRKLAQQKVAQRVEAQRLISEATKWASANHLSDLLSAEDQRHSGTELSEQPDKSAQSSAQEANIKPQS